MTLSSMTGYAHVDGVCGDDRWSWELKSVNSKGLDLRLRMPSGMDGLEAEIRKCAAKSLSRGNVSCNLQIETASTGRLQVDEAALDALVKSAKRAAKKHGLKKPRVENLMGLKGVLSTEESVRSEEALAERNAAVVAGFASAIEALAKMRAREGAQLSQMLISNLNEIAALVEKARVCDSAMPEAIHARLGQQIDELLEKTAASGERDRISQEAAYLAVKADVREELDRLDAHVDAALALIAGGSPAGRKLDFLAQEFAREANTLCSKAGDQALSRIGLDLKAVVDQMREQIQNVE